MQAEQAVLGGAVPGDCAETPRFIGEFGPECGLQFERGRGVLTKCGQPAPAEFFDQPFVGDDVDPGDAGGRLRGQRPTNAYGNKRTRADHERWSERVEVTLEHPRKLGHGPGAETAGDDLGHEPTLNRPSDIPPMAWTTNPGDLRCRDSLGRVLGVKKLWVRREIEAPPGVVWNLLTNLGSWPLWGPSVRKAELGDERFGLGARGTVTTVMGFGLPFEITAFDDGARWAWRVAGVTATDHTVDSLGDNRCRVGFGVPWPAALYLAVCRVALRRLESMAAEEERAERVT